MRNPTYPILPRHSPVVDARSPLPYPNGWFGACFSRDLKPGRIQTVPFMGGELVVYRTQSGAAKAISPYCPHLGAHLGHGGKVDGEHLVCPYHGLSFAPGGQCQPDRDSPPLHGGPRLTEWPLREVNGVVFVWHDAERRAPTWDVPELDLRAFSRADRNTFDIPGYVQDIAENGIDRLHLVRVHQFADAQVSAFRAAGPRLTYEITTHASRQWLHFRNTYCGLGYMIGEIDVPTLRVQLKVLSCPVPTAPLEWRARVLNFIHVDALDRWPGPLRRGLQDTLVLALRVWFRYQIGNDIKIWNHRRYNHEARLVPGDGPIMAFRRWAAQFYPTHESVADSRRGLERVNEI